LDQVHNTAKSLESRVGTGIEETYDGLRQGDSSNLRRVAFQGLIKAKSHEKKLLEAAQYLAGYEFYFWRGFGLDGGKNRRDELITGAAQQFFKDVFELYNFKASVFAMADPDLGDAFNKEASFNALAAALHTDNPKQKENIRLLGAKGVYIEDLNFLKIIQQGLSTRINVEDKKMALDQVPGHLREVMNNEEVAIKLLQARWNFLAVAAMDKSFHFKKHGTFLRYGRAALNLVTRWELDFSKLNSGQHFYLGQASETREFLKSVGIETKPDMLMVAFIKRMKPTGLEKLSAENRAKVDEMLRILDSFKE
jgi:hypothetical protein